jgi:hypothetical protein
MRWLHCRAVAIVCSTVLCAVGCLTTQEAPSDDGGIEDPPITVSGGSGGSNNQGGDAGESTGGRETGGSGGTSSGGGSDSGCNDDSDCEFRIDGRSRCSVPSGECVDCLSAGDCASNEECVDNECRGYTVCSTRDDCPPGLVCYTAVSVCVECVSASDCAASEICVSNACRERCSVDSHCAPTGQRCDAGTGYCVDCLGHADCDESRHCDDATGTCVRDVCVGGSSTCEGNGYVGCDADGTMELGFVPCATMQICVEDDDGARCETQICTPNATMCSETDETIVTCSDDGLSVDVEEDCAESNQICIGGECVAAVCEANTTFCAGNTVQQCDSTGMSSYTLQTCPTNQRCNPATTMCAGPICTPNEPACDGNVFTTCDEEGFGYTGTGTDCTMTDQVCGPMGCITGVIDTIPASPTLYADALPNYLMTNVYSVTAARNLTHIEQYMNPSSAITLTWHVYESTTQTGTYTRIFSTPTTSTTGEGYQSSGAISVPLVAGRFYAIGVSWTTATGFGYQTGMAPSQLTSFGQHISSILVSTSAPAASISYSAPSTYFVPQRLTTAP